MTCPSTKHRHPKLRHKPDAYVSGQCDEALGEHTYSHPAVAPRDTFKNSSGHPASKLVGIFAKVNLPMPIWMKGTIEPSHTLDTNIGGFRALGMHARLTSTGYTRPGAADAALRSGVTPDSYGPIRSSSAGQWLSLVAAQRAAYNVPSVA
ncbi:hypothetical protein BKA67DRAFT_531784 [Truncatella angustata]|uniref:Uncharacterized protein n=1 Tax=Truncatella angustata TaxID=152316 RepID=A0A9P8UQI4_9PEZI|nr:uncharacterized protein BKA67DRAFT_531784 [Truncatella angustata]KAH6656519.1 hypothetical protein BKA67DRAFT_531784 [Truncatella angustata]